MNRDRERGGHRDITAPWWTRLTCWATDHDLEPTTAAGRWLCVRCDRTIRRGAQ